MRVIYLHQYFNTPAMSGGTRSFEIGRRLVAAGHSVQVVTSWQQPAEQAGWFTTDETGIKVHWLPVPYSNHMSYQSRLRAFLCFALAAARRAASLEGDVILATSTPLTIALPGAYVAHCKRIPMVFEVRDLWPELPIAIGALKNPLLQWSARRLEQFAYRNAARVIALSPGMVAGVAQSGYPGRRIALAPNGADLGLFERNPLRGREMRRTLGIADDKIVIGYAGTLGRINGVGYLARIAALLKDDHRFVFLVVGDGQEQAQVRALARDLDVLDRSFLMLPPVPKLEMPAVLWSIDIATSLFLPLPEMESNSANKFFDALAAGCCVAINYGGWQADLLKVANAGVQLASDAEQGAHDLRAFAADPLRLAICGSNARRLAEERFSRDELADRVEEVLTEAIADYRNEKGI